MTVFKFLLLYLWNQKLEHDLSSFPFFLSFSFSKLPKLVQFWVCSLVSCIWSWKLSTTISSFSASKLQYAHEINKKVGQCPLYSVLYFQLFSSFYFSSDVSFCVSVLNFNFVELVFSAFYSVCSALVWLLKLDIVHSISILMIWFCWVLWYFLKFFFTNSIHLQFSLYIYNTYFKIHVFYFNIWIITGFPTVTWFLLGLSVIVAWSQGKHVVPYLWWFLLFRQGLGSSYDILSLPLPAWNLCFRTRWGLGSTGTQGSYSSLLQWGFYSRNGVSILAVRALSQGGCETGGLRNSFQLLQMRRHWKEEPQGSTSVQLCISAQSSVSFLAVPWLLDAMEHRVLSILWKAMGLEQQLAHTVSSLCPSHRPWQYRDRAAVFTPWSRCTEKGDDSLSRHGPRKL